MHGYTDKHSSSRYDLKRHAASKQDQQNTFHNKLGKLIPDGQPVWPFPQQDDDGGVSK